MVVDLPIGHYYTSNGRPLCVWILFFDFFDVKTQVQQCSKVYQRQKAHRVSRTGGHNELKRSDPRERK